MSKLLKDYDLYNHPLDDIYYYRVLPTFNDEREDIDDFGSDVLCVSEMDAVEDDRIDFKIDGDSFVYDGTEQRPAVSDVTVDGEEIDESCYSVDYSNNEDVGTATVNVRLNKKYGHCGKATKQFTITKADLGDMKTEVGECVYDGTEQEPELTVSYVHDDGSSVFLKPVRDYKIVECKDNINAGTASVKITGAGNYEGELEKSFEIKPASIEKGYMEVLGDGSGFRYYTGMPITPDVLVFVNRKELVRDIDYTVTYSNNVKPSSGNNNRAHAIISGIGNYCGTVDKDFFINPFWIRSEHVELVDGKEYAFDGEEVTPRVRVVSGETELVEGRDYTVSYEDNDRSGRGYVIIQGIDTCEGVVRIDFNITVIEIEDNNVELVNGYDYIYSGEDIIPEARVTVDGEELIEGRDYTCTVSYNTMNDIIANGWVTICGKGRFIGIVYVVFHILPYEIQESDVELVNGYEYIYEGEEITPEVKVTANGKTLTLGEDYRLDYHGNYCDDSGKVFLKADTLML